SVASASRMGVARPRSEKRVKVVFLSCATARARRYAEAVGGFGNAPRELGRLGGWMALSAGRWPAPGEASASVGGPRSRGRFAGDRLMHGHRSICTRSLVNTR